MGADDHSRPTIAISPLQKQTPQMGQTVLYHFRGPDNRVWTRPAVITSVGEKEKVNLLVFFEPGDRQSPPYAFDVSPHDEGGYMPDTWSFREQQGPTTSRVFG